ncbi:MAG: hypothetical protein V4629_06270 [Pseudomonadota bacterium]
MRAVIVAAGISIDPNINSSIEHAVIAAKNCIATSNIDTQDIDYLFNVGIYRDSNMVEPSMAALIQKGIGLNLDFLKFSVKTPAFSTDIMNGASGAINAIHIADALFKSGKKGYVLIVSSDVHPSNKVIEGFSVRPNGAAILLAPSSHSNGFHQFSFQDARKAVVGENSYLNFNNQQLSGRTSITIETKPDYYQILLESTKSIAKQFCEKYKLDLNHTALIAPSFTQDFATQLGETIGVPSDFVINLWSKYGNTHTSVFGIGYYEFLNSNILEQCTNLLFVGAGASLNTGCALYKL